MPGRNHRNVNSDNINGNNDNHRSANDNPPVNLTNGITPLYNAVADQTDTNNYSTGQGSWTQNHNDSMQLLQQIQDSTSAMYAYLNNNLMQIEPRMIYNFHQAQWRNSNNVARVANIAYTSRNLYWQLVPLVSLQDGQRIPGFPQSLADIQNMTRDACQAVLMALNYPALTNGDTEVAREYLKSAVGICVPSGPQS
ncbi:hypothetical protein P280DRAFT_521302 [Massarina eburnea CBS 473.64]|uniref:Uncharacterized protein n=1 Tax=Massarina eburnea CBS 473.64 TaxID=1395130 RepID=A0A6A6RP97_9PLEO|nr:hypothetical protein P280DRAFT_521302 [Massarina eburnea CBS 473.64]